MDVNNVMLSNFVYQGGDDCVAIKPRSYNVDIRNVTCVGGNGIAIGSLGQYLEDNSVSNILVDNVTVSLSESEYGVPNTENFPKTDHQIQRRPDQQCLYQDLGRGISPPKFL